MRSPFPFDRVKKLAGGAGSGGQPIYDVHLVASGLGACHATDLDRIEDWPPEQSFFIVTPADPIASEIHRAATWVEALGIEAEAVRVDGAAIKRLAAVGGDRDSRDRGRRRNAGLQSDRNAAAAPQRAAAAVGRR